MQQTQPPIAFFSAQAAAFGLDLSACVQRVVNSGWYVLGPEVRAFEAAFAAHVGVAHAVGVGNGTDALVLALRALGVGAGQSVLTVANAGCYSSTAIEAVGARPVYADVDPQHLNMSPDALASALADGGLAAVIVTHLYGRMADMSSMVRLCRQAGVPLIEDCAQAHGALLQGHRAGAWGTLGCFSFYPTKNLGALGDGGAVVTNDDALAARVQALRQYGWKDKYRVAQPGGGNSRLDELQAAVLAAKLPLLDEANERRRAIAAQYQAGLADLPLQLPASADAADVVHLYVIRSAQRQALHEHLNRRGISSEIHYPWPDHKQPVRTRQAWPELPHTEAACAQVLSLPCHPGLQLAQVQRVVQAVRDFFQGV